jgi:hypothetical protein
MYFQTIMLIFFTPRSHYPLYLPALTLHSISPLSLSPKAFGAHSFPLTIRFQKKFQDKVMPR